MKHKIIRIGAACAIIALILMGAASRANAAPQGKTFTVNDISDTPDAAPGNGKCETATGNGVCTLRAAIQEANHLAGTDTINLAPDTTYLLTRQGADDDALNGDLDIADAVNIVGGDGTVIDANGGVTHERVLDIYSTVVISSVTIQNGEAQYGAGILVNEGGSLTLNHSAVMENHAPGNTDAGGGIYNNGTLVLNYTGVGLNSSGGRGGGIVNRASTTLAYATIIGNTSSYGAGIDNEGSATATIKQTIVVSNIASELGGGIINDGTLNIDTSTVNKNHASEGGGIYNSSALSMANSTLSNNVSEDVTYKNYGGGGLENHSGTATLTNTTVSGNSAKLSGGGIHNDATLRLHSVTITANVSDSDGNNVGGGGGIDALNTYGEVSLENSIVAGNWTGGIGSKQQDCRGWLVSKDYNLFQNVAACNFSGAYTHNQIVSNPQLGALLPNGGSTHTHALLAGSPAINAGNPSGCKDESGNVLVGDQRGYARTAGAACDVGAFEYGSVVPPTNTPTPKNTTKPTLTPQPTKTPVGCGATPGIPVQTAPTNGKQFAKNKVKLTWDAANCAAGYKLLVKIDTKHGKPFLKKNDIKTNSFKLKQLTKSHVYFWKVKACNASGCSKSKWLSFRIK